MGGRPILGVSFWDPCPDYPLLCGLVLVVPPWLSWPGCHGLAVMAWLSWPGCHGLAVMAQLSWPGCHGLAVMAWLSWPSCHGLAGKSWRPVLDALSLQSR